MRALRLLACFVSALWARGAFAEMTTFTCPADNNTLQYYDEAPSGRKLYIIRCGTSMLDFLDLNTDVTQSGATRSQCLTLCDVDYYCLAWNFVPYDPDAPDSGTILGDCYGWTVLDSEPDEPNERLPIQFGSDSEDGTKNTGVIKAMYWAEYDQIYYAPPAVAYQDTITITTTTVSVYPITTTSVITRPATITSAVTRTTLISTLLPDSTAIYPSIQLVPTTFATLQVFTITIVRTTTQQVVTVVPTVLIQTAVNTLYLRNTLQNTVTNTQVAVTTVAPTVQFQQTVTVTA